MKFKVAAIFSDNMVLQRGKKIAIFGEGEEASCIEVSLRYSENGIEKINVARTVVLDGKWLLYLPAMQENDNCTMLITDGQTSKAFHNIAIGEVWFCGGQSNMEFELQNTTTGKEHLQKDTPDVRFYNVQRKAYVDEAFLASEEKTSWQLFDSETAKTWSAVGYLYGKHLSEKLGVTVGLIGCNWGGTSASNWMSREYMALDEGAATYLEEYDKAVAGKTVEALNEEYEAYLVHEAEWNKKCDALYATVPGITWDEVQARIGVCLWPGPMCEKHPFRPGGLYETMVKRVAPYSIKGWLFYQGESDDHKPHTYFKLQELLTKQWRADWQDEAMPFLLVQLPGHQYKQDEDRKHWCIIREAQEQITESMDHVGMAVAIDVGEFDNIHPQDKEAVAERLYRLAMYEVYEGLAEEEGKSPTFASCQMEGDKVTVHFKHVTSGLVLANDTKGVIGVELAGEDEVYYPAEAYVEGNTVIASSAKVERPVAIRYLWTNYPKDGVNLYNKYGLPVAPFKFSF